MDFVLSENSEYKDKESIVLCTLSDFKKENKKKAEKGIILKGKYTQKDIQKAMQLTKHVVVEYNDDIRLTLEKNKGLFIYGCENVPHRDFMHFRNSGLNHILAKIAYDNNHTFLFNFKDYLDLSKSKKAVVLGRLKQNIKLYKKYKVRFQFASFGLDEYTYKGGLEVYKRLLESNRLF